MSPLLANVMLDDFDKELTVTRRGHNFVRNAKGYSNTRKGPWVASRWCERTDGGETPPPIQLTRRLQNSL